MGIALVGQTSELAPADKKIYALRDAISCVDSIPLIASSIMSKKIAGGADKIVLEVTLGRGAFMKKKEDAIYLSKQMNEIGKMAGKETICILTNMDEPLGRSVGNTLEVIEVVESLKGNIAPDVEEVVCTLGAYMLKMAKRGDNIEENKQKILKQINNGEAFKKWMELVEAQGGVLDYIEDISCFPRAAYEYTVISNKSGNISKLDAGSIGEIFVLLGAGRIKKEDNIEKEVGIVFQKKIGDSVKKGEKMATIYANSKEKAEIAIKKVQDAYEIVDEKVEKPKVIVGIL